MSLYRPNFNIICDYCLFLTKLVTNKMIVINKVTTIIVDVVVEF